MNRARNVPGTVRIEAADIGDDEIGIARVVFEPGDAHDG
jgi:hypothetical protein